MNERNPRSITEPGFYWIKQRKGHDPHDFMPDDWEPALRLTHGTWSLLGTDIPVNRHKFGDLWHEAFVVGDRIAPPAP